MENKETAMIFAEELEGEIEALRVDLEAVAVAAKELCDEIDQYYDVDDGIPNVSYGFEWKCLEEALSRPGVQAVLEKKG